VEVPAAFSIMYLTQHVHLFLQGFIDVGGGLGIDYDGTKSQSSASANYSMQVILSSLLVYVGLTVSIAVLPVFFVNFLSVFGQKLQGYDE
jgi:hypothetical protein